MIRDDEDGEARVSPFFGMLCGCVFGLGVYGLIYWLVTR